MAREPVWIRPAGAVLMVLGLGGHLLGTALAGPASFRGELEYLDRGRAVGWVVDMSKPEEVLTVELLLDGVPVARTAANRLRPGLATLGVREASGFHVAFMGASDAAGHAVEIRALSPGGTAWRLAIAGWPPGSEPAAALPVGRILGPVQVIHPPPWLASGPWAGTVPSLMGTMLGIWVYDASRHTGDRVLVRITVTRAGRPPEEIARSQVPSSACPFLDLSWSWLVLASAPVDAGFPLQVRAEALDREGNWWLLDRTVLDRDPARTITEAAP